MKLKLTPLLILAFLAFSCEKKIIERIDSAEFGFEEIEPAFSQCTYQMSTDISGHKDSEECLWWGTINFYSWSMDYRLAEGFESNGRAFYPIEKKWEAGFDHRYCCGESEVEWTKSEDWFRSDRLYRYDTQNKKAMIYQGISDTEPETIMDFDLEVGDYWVIDDEYELLFYVDEVSQIELNGVAYPVYKGHYSMNYKFFKIANKEQDQPVYLSPFNPNPFKMTDDFKDFEQGNWSIFQKGIDEQKPAKWLSESNGNGHVDRRLIITNSLDDQVTLPNVSSSYLYY